MATTEKFVIGDTPTTTLELMWTIREADLARDTTDDLTRPLYWPPRPSMPKGQEFAAPTELVVLLTLLSFVGEPDKDGSFSCRPKVATIARITGLDASTIRRYLICLRERGGIKWRLWGSAPLFTFNTTKLARAAKLAVAAYAEIKTTKSEADDAEEARLAALWDSDLEEKAWKRNPTSKPVTESLPDAAAADPTAPHTAASAERPPYEFPEDD